jgi:hypothetical protein
MGMSAEVRVFDLMWDIVATSEVLPVGNPLTVLLVDGETGGVVPPEAGPGITIVLLPDSIDQW